MEPSDQQLLIERIARTLLFFCGIAAVIWFIPDWVQAYKFPVQQPNQKIKKIDFDLVSVWF